MHDPNAIRSRFPALSTSTVFFENAGGSQVPDVVANAVRDYMLHSYVQLGVDYELSRRSTALVDRAHDFVRLLMNGEGVGEVVLGASCSSLCLMLADAYAPLLGEGDEIVIAEAGHEANVGPWRRLARQGVTLRPWRVFPDSGRATLDGLADALSERTRIVAFPHVSNLLGEVVDVKAATTLAHEVGARVVADGVAYAPHRAMDVADWGVDWYVYSTYKVYGPHMGALFGRHEAFAELEGPNHFFIPKDAIPYKFEVGGVSHEGCAGLLALGDYLRFLAGHEQLTRQTVVDAFDVMTACERPLQERLVDWLREHPRVRIVGPESAGDERVGTVSFLHATRPSAEIAAAAHAADFAIRSGHMYAWRQCEAMGIDPLDGVVRASFLHYNTLDEMERFLELLDRTL